MFKRSVISGRDRLGASEDLVDCAVTRVPCGTAPTFCTAPTATCTVISSWKSMRLGSKSIDVDDRNLEPGGGEDLSDVLSGVFAHAVESRGARPEHRPCQVVRVPRDLGIEKIDGSLLGPQQFVGIVEVSAGFGDRPLSIVVEFPVLVTGDDVPGL